MYSKRIRFTILHMNGEKGLQYNSFHKETIEEALDAFKEKGYLTENIAWIKRGKKEIYNKETGRGELTHD